MNSRNSARKFLKLGKVLTILIHQNVLKLPKRVRQILHSTPFVHSPSDTVRCIFSILQPQGKLKRMKKEPQSTPLEKSNISLSATRGSRSGILILAIFIADLKSTYSKGSESNQRKPIPLTNLLCTLCMNNLFVESIQHLYALRAPSPSPITEKEFVDP